VRSKFLYFLVDSYSGFNWKNWSKLVFISIVVSSAKTIYLSVLRGINLLLHANIFWFSTNFTAYFVPLSINI